MTEQTRTNVAAAGTSPQVARGRPVARMVPACTGLVLGLLALGPGLGPGYLLSYDMVFVPRPPFNAAVLGTAGVLPRAVPSDAVMAGLARVLPADAVQKLVLLAIFVLACAGAARLLSRKPLAAQLAAGVLYAWNPFMAERLILGQWALLLGYAGLPWVLAACAKPGLRLSQRPLRLVVALLPAAVGGFAAISISALVALPAAALQRGTASMRLITTATTLAVLGVVSLPWLIPSLTRQVHTSPAGVAAFAARADTPFGTLGSLIALGGAWNAQTVPAGYGGAGSVLWLCLAVSALGGFLLLGRARWPALGVGAAAGLLIASLGAVGFGQDLLRSMIAFWPGFAVLRDGQQFVAPLALAEAAGFGLVVARVLQLRKPRWLAEGKAILAGGLTVAAAAFLPGLAWGAAGRLRPVEYPAGWLAARKLINTDPHPGNALLLPWGAYRRFGWNHGEAVLDPWPRLLTRQVIWNDGVQVGSLQIPPEDPAAVAISSAVTSGAALTSRLEADGYRYVIVDAGISHPFLSRLQGCLLVFSGAGLDVYRVPG
ncbi:MAG TPA: hypothetical protein VNW50_03135 [Streptosporangiaceae bacterium]|nr:hypothetical protein [Streptosporangiaceae bacterium]